MSQCKSFIVFFHSKKNNLIKIIIVVAVCSVVSNSLWPHEQQHARLLWPSLSPGFCSNSHPLSQWCHPTISSSAVPFFFCFSLSQYQLHVDMYPFFFFLNFGLFFVFKIYLFMYLLLGTLGLCCCAGAFPSCSKWGLLSSWHAQASHCGGFSCCGARVRESRLLWL